MRCVEYDASVAAVHPPSDCPTRWKRVTPSRSSVEVVPHEMIDAGEPRPPRAPEARMMSDDQSEVLCDREQPIEPTRRPTAMEKHDGLAGSRAEAQGVGAVDIETCLSKPDDRRSRRHSRSSPRGASRVRASRGQSRASHRPPRGHPRRAEHARNTPTRSTLPSAPRRSLRRFASHWTAHVGVLRWAPLEALVQHERQIQIRAFDARVGLSNDGCDMALDATMMCARGIWRSSTFG